MGLEGAVRLGFKKELEATPAGEARDALYEKLVAEMYQKGRATEAAAYLEIDMVHRPCGKSFRDLARPWLVRSWFTRPCF